MKAGRLRHRLTLYTVTEQVDPGDAPAETVFATVWGALEPLQGRELFAAQQVQSEVTGRATIRYLAGVDPTMRVGLGSRRWEILGIIDPQERHRELQLLTKEIQR